MVFSSANFDKYLLLTAVLILAATSCQKEPFRKRGSCSTIVPVVRSVSMKAQTSADLLSERVVSSADGFDLIEMVYDNIPSYPDGTKGTVITTDNLDGFTMDAYAETEWHDNTKELGEEGSVDNPYDPGLYFSKTVSNDGSGWSIDGEPTWLNLVPISFWSWNSVQPEPDDVDPPFNKAGFELTVNPDVADQLDPVFAYNKESREFDANGEMQGGKDENIDIYFFHALSAVQFLKGDVNSDYRISGITLKQVDSHTDCTMEGGTDGSIGFTHDSDTPYDFQLSFSAGNEPAAPETVTFDTGDARTFFMIPQSLGGDKKLQVEFTNQVAEGEDKTSPVFDLTGEWLAGRYYIYKIKLAGGVTVDIEEIADNTSKSEVKFRNTSSVNEFIRAAVVANWYDNDGNIVAPWNGGIPLNTTDWESGSDGFYYCKGPVSTKDVTKNLFSSTFNVPSPAPVSGAHFEMTILVQAVCSDGFGGINGPSAFAL